MDQIIGGLWPLSQKILFHFKVSKINIIIIVTNLDSKHTHTLCKQKNYVDYSQKGHHQQY